MKEKIKNNQLPSNEKIRLFLSRLDSWTSKHNEYVGSDNKTLCLTELKKLSKLFFDVDTSEVTSLTYDEYLSLFQKITDRVNREISSEIKTFLESLATKISELWHKNNTKYKN